MFLWLRWSTQALAPHRKQKFRSDPLPAITDPFSSFCRDQSAAVLGALCSSGARVVLLETHGAGLCLMHQSDVRASSLCTHELNSASVSNHCMSGSQCSLLPSLLRRLKQHDGPPTLIFDSTAVPALSVPERETDFQTLFRSLELPKTSTLDLELVVCMLGGSHCLLSVCFLCPLLRFSEAHTRAFSDLSVEAKMTAKHCFDKSGSRHRISVTVS